MAALACASLTTLAQTPPPYGLPITLEQAKKAMVAAEAEARKNNWPVVITIVDTGGHWVMLQNLESQHASIDIAAGKARSAVNFRRPSKRLEDSLAANGSALRLLALKDAPRCKAACPAWWTARSSAASACRVCWPRKTRGWPRPDSTR